MKNKKTAVLKWAALAVFLLLAGCFYSCGGRKNPQMTLSGQNGRGFAAETAPRKTLEQGGNAGQSNAGRRESGQSGAGQEPEIGETRDAAEISEPPNGAETSESVHPQRRSVMSMCAARCRTRAFTSLRRAHGFLRRFRLRAVLRQRRRKTG